MQPWIGTSGFQYPEWRGNFYPETLSTAKMLTYYADRFASTEVNYTFRSFPSAKTLARWVQETPAAFRFSLKAPQRITHFAQLKDCGDIVQAFGQVITGLGGKLGPVLFQLPPSLKRDIPRLAAFLHEIPPGMRSAFEFRHASWFDDAVFTALREANAALCIAESADLATPAVSTADFGYLRLRREDYTNADITQWAAYVGTQSEHWRDAYIYFKHEEAGVGPKFAGQMQGLLTKNDASQRRDTEVLSQPAIPL